MIASARWAPARPSRTDTCVLSCASCLAGCLRHAAALTGAGFAGSGGLAGPELASAVASDLTNASAMLSLLASALPPRRCGGDRLRELVRDLASDLHIATELAGELGLAGRSGLAGELGLTRAVGRADRLVVTLASVSLAGVPSAGVPVAGVPVPAAEPAGPGAARAARRVAGWSVRLLPAADRYRYGAEFQAELFDLRGTPWPVQVRYALRLLLRSGSLRWELRRPSPATPSRWPGRC